MTQEGQNHRSTLISQNSYSNATLVQSEAFYYPIYVSCTLLFENKAMSISIKFNFLVTEEYFWNRMFMVAFCAIPIIQLILCILSGYPVMDYIHPSKAGSIRVKELRF